MALKIWLIRKIDEIELELKYMRALLIMLEKVENATDYSDSDSDMDSESEKETSEIKKITLNTETISLNETVDILNRLQAFENQMGSALYQNTAENIARNRTATWWMLNLSYED